MIRPRRESSHHKEAIATLKWAFAMTALSFALIFVLPQAHAASEADLQASIARGYRVPTEAELRAAIAKAFPNGISPQALQAMQDRLNANLADSQTKLHSTLVEVSKSQIVTGSEAQSLLALKSSQIAGQGVLFLLDGQVRILTNSHVINGEKNLTAVSALAPGQSFQTQVLYDSPADDIAVLDIGNERASDPQFIAIAQASFVVCSASANGFCPGAQIVDSANGTGPQPVPQDIIVFDGTVSRKIEAEDDHLSGGQKIDDQYVSGSYPFLWSIRALTKGGVSGGRYDRNGHFAGLVTKVSLGMQTETYAIPVEGLVPVIAGLIKNPHSNKNTGGRFLIASKGGGGGDTGNGGDPIVRDPGSSDATWTLNDLCDISGCFSRQIANPFANAMQSSAVIIAGQPIVAFEQSKFMQPSIFQAATAARFNWLRLHLAHFSLLAPGANDLGNLFQARTKAAMPLRYVRVWKKNDRNVLTNADPVSGPFMDGIIQLLGSRPNNGYQAFDSLTPPRFEIVTGNQLWFEMLCQEENLRVSVARDFSHAMLALADRSNPIALSAAPDTNLMKHVLVSADGGKRIVLIYQEDDLTKLISMLIETETHLYEFTSIQPNEGILP